MLVLSVSAVSADNLTGSGEVSGDVDVATANPFTTSGQLNYDIPAEASDIKFADLYVNVYSGSAQNTYGANLNVSLNTANGENQVGNEVLWIEDGSTDGTIYKVNDYTDKCFEFSCCHNYSPSCNKLKCTITLIHSVFYYKYHALSI